MADNLDDQGRGREADELAARALAHPAGGSLRHLELIRQAHIAWREGRLGDGLRCAEQAFGELEHDDPLLTRPAAAITIAEVLLAAGRDDEAISWFGRTLQLAEQIGQSSMWLHGCHSERALLLASRGRLDGAERELALAGRASRGHDGWREYLPSAAEAAVAALRGDAGTAAQAAQAAFGYAAAGVLADRVVAVSRLTPLLADVGLTDLARRALDEHIAVAEGRQGRSVGRYLIAHLLALRAWLRHITGDPGWATDLQDFWALAADRCRGEILRTHWPRFTDLLNVVIEHNVLDAREVAAALDAMAPGGLVLVSLLDHPSATARRAAVGPALSAGHPEALARLQTLVNDADPNVAATATAARRHFAAQRLPLRFTLLGGFSAQRGRWEIPDGAWRRPLVARLTRFLLIHHERLVPEDELFCAFWPDKTATAARRNLHVAISVARGVLDTPGANQSVIEVRDRAYRFALTDVDLVDAQRFQTAAKRALTAPAAERRTLLELAASYWNGEPLPEDRYADWTARWREQLTDRYIDVLNALADSYASAGDADAGIRVGRRLLELDALNEHAHRRLMAAYAAAGRVGHALRQYLACRRALLDELGIEPSRETSDLQARLLAGDRP